MKKAILLVCFLMLTFTIAFAQGKRPLTVEDYFALKDLSDVHISPDGKWVAYVVSSSDEEKDESSTYIYLAPLAGGDPTQVTFSGEDAQPAWSPDNKYLAFLSTRSKKPQVYLLNRTGGEAYPITDVTQGVDDFQWSPDAKKLLLVLTDPDPDERKAGKGKAAGPYVITSLFFKFDGIGYLKDLHKHLYVFDVASRVLKQITTGPYDDASQLQSDSDFPNPPQWSPDGKQIVFVSNRTQEPDSNTNTDLFLVSADGGEPKKLTTNEGPDQMPDWSPDGKSITYVTSLEPKFLWFDQLEIAVVPASGGQPRLLTSDLDRNAWAPRFGVDGRVYFLLEDSGTQRLVSVPAAGGPLAETTAEKVVYGYDLGPGGTVAVQATRPELPGDIFVASGGATRQLTHLNESALKGIELGKTERIKFTSKDGTPVEGFVIKPPGFDRTKKYPAILWMHGGPNQQETGEFYFRPQFLASRGYVVILLSYRGSTGYGKAFQREIYGAWGGKEIEDLMAGLDFVIAQGYVDPEHLGMGGHSYGAMLTDYLITMTARFKAAITDAGESNYLMNYGVDQYVLDWEAEVGKPWENPQRYLELSPYFRLKNVKTPTLIVCGQEDWNVPLINSEQLYLSLRRLGVETMLLVYPEQPHEFWRPSYIKDRYQRYAAWFDHYLKGAPNKTPPK
jgi:dipeptidyl aminopeptidase/acylaminoacyl peptidase